MLYCLNFQESSGATFFNIRKILHSNHIVFRSRSLESLSKHTNNYLHSSVTKLPFVTEKACFICGVGKEFLRSFAKLRKATIIRFSYLSVCLCRSIRLSGRLQGKTRLSQWTDFHEKWHSLIFFRKAVEIIQVCTTKCVDNGATCNSSLVSKKNFSIVLQHCIHSTFRKLRWKH